MTAPFAPEPAPENDNGLVADEYARLRTVDRRESELMLTAMAEAEIACYIAVPEHDEQRTREMFVDARARSRADEIADEAHARFVRRRVALDSDEVDSRFAEIIGSFGGPSEVPDRAAEPGPSPLADTGDAPEAWRAAARDMLDEPPEEEHFEPPPPEPLPRPTGRVVAGVLLMIAGCVFVFVPSSVPLAGTATLAIGVLLLGAGLGWLVMQLKDRPDDPFDDGSRV